MTVSLKDVAQHAGVSIKTVSNVVNDYPFVSAPTRERVQAAIRELGYRPNLSARSLRTGRSGLVALAVPELRTPYFAELADALVHQAGLRGWTVMIEQTDGQRDREVDVLIGHRHQTVDGVILSPLGLTATDLRKSRPTVPVVLLGERIYKGPVDHVSIDNEAAARQAVEHLLATGRRAIAAIGAQPKNHGTARRRLDGYLAALTDAGRPARPAHIKSVPEFSRAAGAEAMGKLLAEDPRPDAVFCFSDLLAIGALHQLHARGIRVPEDIAIIGFDDIDDAAYCTPSLSTIAPDKVELAEAAIRLLHSRIQGDDSPVVELTTAHRVVPRAST